MDVKKGDKVVCPHCQADAIVVIKAEMDGWEKLGDCLACNLCGEKLADLDTTKEQAEKDKNKSKGLDAFADFLGTDSAIEKDENLLGDVSERHFCKDCKNYVENPFYTRCMLHEKDVNPMDDCSDFEKAPKK